MGDVDGEIPVFVGLIPLGIGLAYLIYYFVEGRKVEARWLEHDLRAAQCDRAPPGPERCSRAQPAPQSG